MLLKFVVVGLSSSLGSNAAAFRGRRPATLPAPPLA